MSPETVIRHLDITGEVCPMTLVRVRMGLDQISTGEVIQVLMAAGEPVASIPRMLQSEGHQVLSVVPDGNAFRVRLRKA